MCGIAGMLDLRDSRRVPDGVLARMADSLQHRGPDEGGVFTEPGFGLTVRRLSIVGVSDGRQPATNEEESVVVGFNGEIFEHIEIRALLEARGHRLATQADTELIAHLWEDHQYELFNYLRGQFAFALWDRRRRKLLMARDRYGICPLYWTQTDGWLLFGSEIKALLATGMVTASPDPCGIDQVFHFFAVPGPRTCFAGIRSLQPGQFLTVDKCDGSPRLHRYWKLEFPEERWQEGKRKTTDVVDELEHLMLQSVERRLRADVPVVSYLSGGIDSTLVVALAKRVLGRPLPTYTVGMRQPRLDETRYAGMASRLIGGSGRTVSLGDDDIVQAYAELVSAAEAPVVDTSCTGLLLLAKAVHADGYKVALTGEGADEWFSGYAWFKVHRLLRLLRVAPWLDLSKWPREMFLRVLGAPTKSLIYFREQERALGHSCGFHDLYRVMMLSRFWFYSSEMFEAVADFNPYLDLEPDLERMKKWHPLDQDCYWGSRIHLPGLLLSLKGDRIAMHSAVEMRYPFLDEDLTQFLIDLHPCWKLRGMQDKYILRLLGSRYLPRELAWRSKMMYRAPRDSFFKRPTPPIVSRLLSTESLKKTGYFDVQSVRRVYEALRSNRIGIRKRHALELGLVAVVSTQLWHQRFIDATLG